MSLSIQQAEELTKPDEKLAVKAIVKTEGFEKTVIFMSELMRQFYLMAARHKSFRMELFYDAEALNVDYCFFVPKEPESLKSRTEQEVSGH